MPNTERELNEIKHLNELPKDVQEASHLAGIEPSEKDRSGSFFQSDQRVLCARSGQEGIEVLDTETALKKYDGLPEYFWKAVDPDKDEFTREVQSEPPKGYFLRALAGCETTYPLQACLFINKQGLSQKVHNIIVAEEGAHLNIITGCTVASHVKSGMHIGISEFFVRKNAKITFTMIHNWAEDIEVRPRSVAYVEEGGTFISNYICMKQVKSIQMYPTINLVGRGARATNSSIILGRKNSVIDMGARMVLKAPDTAADIVSRTVSLDESVIYARGHLIGDAPGARAHLECRGLILSDKSKIHAIPELEAKRQDLEMSHEAAVGKIAEREILYLMSRGLSEQEATAAIVRGFLEVDLSGLPENLQKEVRRITEMELGS